MKDLHNAFPTLYRHLTESIPGCTPVQMPSLFDVYATLCLNSASLKLSSKCFNEDFKFPDLVSLSRFDANSKEMSIIEGILDTELEMAFICNIRGDRLNLPFFPPARFDSLRMRIFEWLEATLDTMRSASFFKEGKIPEVLVLQMVRAVSFLHSSGARPLSLVKPFYRKFLDTIGIISLYRYAVTVLDPLLDMLQKHFVNRTHLLQLCTKMNEALEVWISSFEEELPRQFDVRCLVFY